MFKKIEVAANVAIIVAATLVCVVLVKAYLIPKAELGTDGRTLKADSINRAPTDARIQPGTRINLSGLDWAKNGHTLLLAVSDKCHFCSESAPFYQHLAKEHGRTRLVAVLPQSVEDGKRYLGGLNVAVDDVMQAPLTSLGIRGTPTLILVDSNGATVKSWVGKLTPDREADVLASLQ
jgi:hypothetical protein